MRPDRLRSPQPGDGVVMQGRDTTHAICRFSCPGGASRRSRVQRPIWLRRQHNLQSYSNVSIPAQSDLGERCPKADLIYVNAACWRPMLEWLRASSPAGG
jgi:hypothetical protein